MFDNRQKYNRAYGELLTPDLPQSLATRYREHASERLHLPEQATTDEKRLFQLVYLGLAESWIALALHSKSSVPESTSESAPESEKTGVEPSLSWPLPHL